MRRVDETAAEMNYSDAVLLAGGAFGVCVCYRVVWVGVVATQYIHTNPVMIQASPSWTTRAPRPSTRRSSASSRGAYRAVVLMHTIKSTCTRLNLLPHVSLSLP